MAIAARWIVTWVAWCALAATTGSAAPPPTPVRPVEDVYHEVVVVDPYRWLEQGQDPAVQQWTAAQNAHARRILDQLPGADLLRQELRQLLATRTVTYRNLVRAGDLWFCQRLLPHEQQPTVITFPDLDQPEQGRVICDPNQLDPHGHLAIDWFRPCPHGRWLAVSLSSGGSELGDLVLIDVATGTVSDERIPRVNSGTAGGSLAWARDGASFYYTRHVAPEPTSDTAASSSGTQRPVQHVYRHWLGMPVEQDVYELGAELPPIAEIQLATDPASDRVLATVQLGDGGQFAHYLRDETPSWRQTSTFEDGIVQAVFGRQGELYLVRQDLDPRGQIDVLAAADVPRLAWNQARRLIPPGPDTVVTGGVPFWGDPTVVPTLDRIYVLYQQGGPTTVRAFDLQGRPAPAPPLDAHPTVSNLLAVGQDLIYASESYTAPRAFFRYDATAARSFPSGLAARSPVDTRDWQVERRWARSLDGTRVPLTIVRHRQFPLDRPRPCLVTGYGGYGISEQPAFRPVHDLWLRRGAVLAFAHLRGGAEFGEAWHQAGSRRHKQNVFDDFAACLRQLIEEGVTTPDRLGIVGGSNGGLLMGATLTQHPELVRAVAAYVGIYDMLRVELSENGAFNVTEFGTVRDPLDFRALFAYSPYHRVIPGVRYPPTLFVTGANDPRVDPMQSRKMTARLQAATGNRVPILLRTSAHAGHGGGNPVQEQIEQTVDVTAFLMEQLGVMP